MSIQLFWAKERTARLSQEKMCESFRSQTWLSQRYWLSMGCLRLERRKNSLEKKKAHRPHQREKNVVWWRMKNSFACCRQRKWRESCKKWSEKDRTSGPDPSVDAEADESHISQLGFHEGVEDTEHQEGVKEETENSVRGGDIYEGPSTRPGRTVKAPARYSLLALITFDRKASEQEKLRLAYEQFQGGQFYKRQALFLALYRFRKADEAELEKHLVSEHEENSGGESPGKMKYHWLALRLQDQQGFCCS